MYTLYMHTYHKQNDASVYYMKGCSYGQHVSHVRTLGTTANLVLWSVTGGYVNLEYRDGFTL